MVDLKNVKIAAEVSSLQSSWIKRLFNKNFHYWKILHFILSINQFSIASWSAYQATSRDSCASHAVQILFWVLYDQIFPSGQGKLLSKNGWVLKIRSTCIGTRKKFSKSRRLNLFKATEVERKIREIDLLIVL